MSHRPASVDFDEWFVTLSNAEAIVVRAALNEVATDGFYRSGCADQGDGVWLLTDKINNLYLRLYLAEEPKGTLAALYGSISPSHVANIEELKMARLLRDGLRSGER